MTNATSIAGSGTTMASASAELTSTRRAVLVGIASAAAALPVAAVAMPAPARTSDDEEIVALSQQFERLLELEVPLEEESRRLHEAADYLRYEKLGVDRDNEEARQAVIRDRHSEWSAAWPGAAEAVDYESAYDEWNDASEETGRLGAKILNLKPTTLDGLLILARVIDQHDEIQSGDRDEQLLQLITDFAERCRAEGRV
jgi:hypothetical protein